MTSGTPDSMEDAASPPVAAEITSVRFVLSAHLPGQLPSPDYPEIAFAGRSNVGKSSLINRLVGRRNLVKVSAQPGKTRSVNFFLANDRFYLVDLPGYGFARVARDIKAHWGNFVSAYLEERPNLRAVVVVVDLRHEPKVSDRAMLGWLREKGIPLLVVYTKRDKLARGEQARHAQALDAGLGVTPRERILFSSRTGEGRLEMLEEIQQIMK